MNVPGKPATFVAPELPTRAEREFEREFDAMEMHFRERQFVKMLDNAQRLVLMAQRLAIFGRLGIDAIPVDEFVAETENANRWAAQAGRMAEKLGLDNPAGAGDDVEASRG